MWLVVLLVMASYAAPAARGQDVSLDQDVNFDRFSEPVLQALFHVRAIAGEVGGASITPEHLLLGLVRARPDAVSRFLAPADSIEALVLDVKANIAGNQRPVPTVDLIPMSDSVTGILRKASDEAGDRSVQVEHVLGMLEEQDGAVAKALRAHGVRETDVRVVLADSPGQEVSTSPSPRGS